MGSASRAVVTLAATWNGNVDPLACFAANCDFIFLCNLYSGQLLHCTYAQSLRAHGYEVKLPVGDIVDEKGGVIKAPPRSKVRQPLSSYHCAALTLDLQMMVSHILTVFQKSDPSERFIVKKIHKKLNELQFLEYLNTTQPKSEHIVSLHDLFQTQWTSWAILPEMDSIADY